MIVTDTLFISQNSDVNDYQLWVVAGKESGAYPLMGELELSFTRFHLQQPISTSMNLEYILCTFFLD